MRCGKSKYFVRRLCETCRREIKNFMYVPYAVICVYATSVVCMFRNIRNFITLATHFIHSMSLLGKYVYLRVSMHTASNFQ
jgi:hypothetical protein